ncbi:hypothetical protein KKB54_05280 [bacterium]|nr:hypothetical protein [bacterium]MBU1152411.1 hypothetical protein [bacterium]MBU1782315.1 hypothetical protein [bacterium]
MIKIYLIILPLYTLLIFFSQEEVLFLGSGDKDLPCYLPCYLPCKNTC